MRTCPKRTCSAANALRSYQICLILSSCYLAGPIQICVFTPRTFLKEFAALFSQFIHNTVIQVVICCVGCVWENSDNVVILHVSHSCIFACEVFNYGVVNHLAFLSPAHFTFDTLYIVFTTSVLRVFHCWSNGARY